MSGVLVSVIILLFYLAFWQRWMLVRERRAHRLELSKRPVGRVVSAELTKEGLLMKGEVWAPEVWEKMQTDLTGLSIGPFQPKEKE